MMNLERDFDVRMWQRVDELADLERRWQLRDFAFVEGVKRERPFLSKIRNGFHTLTQISKIRIQVTLEMRGPVLE